MQTDPSRSEWDWPPRQSTHIVGEGAHTIDPTSAMSLLNRSLIALVGNPQWRGLCLGGGQSVTCCTCCLHSAVRETSKQEPPSCTMQYLRLPDIHATLLHSVGCCCFLRVVRPTCAAASYAPVPSIFHHSDPLTNAVDCCIHSRHDSQLLRRSKALDMDHAPLPGFELNGRRHHAQKVA
jgi:hypothetical protein